HHMQIIIDEHAEIQFKWVETYCWTGGASHTEAAAYFDIETLATDQEIECEERKAKGFTLYDDLIQGTHSAKAKDKTNAMKAQIQRKEKGNVQTIIHAVNEERKRTTEYEKERQNDIKKKGEKNDEKRRSKFQAVDEKRMDVFRKVLEIQRNAHQRADDALQNEIVETTAQIEALENENFVVEAINDSQALLEKELQANMVVQTKLLNTFIQGGLLPINAFNSTISLL
ncbi:MAG: hypothetical protein EZS28_028650, partial [Streblomastix strix]